MSKLEYRNFWYCPEDGHVFGFATASNCLECDYSRTKAEIEAERVRLSEQVRANTELPSELARGSNKLGEDK